MNEKQVINVLSQLILSIKRISIMPQDELTEAIQKYKEEYDKYETIGWIKDVPSDYLKHLDEYEVNIKIFEHFLEIKKIIEERKQQISK